MCTKTKRKREDNWMGDEKELLIRLVNERKEIIESKKNDFETYRKKQQTWKEINDIFIANGFSRDVDRLREKWRRIKDDAKKEVRLYRKEIKKTGGGSIVEPPPSESFLVENICMDDFRIDESSYDSDRIDKNTTEASDLILDPVTGEFHEPNPEPDDRESAPVSDPNPNPNPKLQNKKQKISRFHMSEYETELLKITKSKTDLEILQIKEIHEEMLRQLKVETATKQINKRIREQEEIKVKLEVEILQIKKQKLELSNTESRPFN